MRNMLTMFFAGLRAKFIRQVTKVSKWLNPGFIKTRISQLFRIFFSKLLDVRPRDQADYYPIFRWLVSKRLAFAIVVGLGILSSIYIGSMIPDNFFGSSEAKVPAYGYRSIPLKFKTGAVQIKGRGGYLAYDGEVEKGAANGTGTLYASDGSLVYQGQFANSRYNGTGTRYYSNGTPRYIGSFSDNMFHGVGSYYRPSGVVEYEGGYQFDVRTGEGTLYNGVGEPVYTGNFLNNGIVFPDFLARPTSEVSKLYTGDSEVYQSDREYCVTMPEIQAMYSVRDGSNSLENEWTVDRVLVLDSKVCIAGTNCSDIGQLKQLMGEPLYYGTAWVTLPEAVAWNTLAKKDPDLVSPVDITAEATLDDVFTVSSYDANAQLYLYSFLQDGLVYTFYFTGAGESNFVMYAIEKA